MQKTWDYPVYLSAMNAMERMAKKIKSLEYPLDQKKIKELELELECTMDLCETYMDDNRDGEKTDEEKKRLEDVEEAYDFCKKQLTLLELQEKAAQAEMNAALRKNEEQRNGAGRAAEETRTLLGNMVLVEMIKKSRTVGADGKPVASPLEKAYVENPNRTVQAICDNTYFRMMTERMTTEMTHDFVINDSAKLVADKLMKIAKQSLSEQEEEELAYEQELAMLLGGI